MRYVWLVLVSVGILTLGIVAIVVAYLVTQSGDDATVVANTGIITVAVTWIVGAIIAHLVDDD